MREYQDMVRYSFIILLFLSFELFAAQTAMVKSDKAIVYADVEGVTPVGYITKERKVRVGEKVRGGKRMLPIVVSGKVCYIEENDLLLEGFKKDDTKPEQNIETNLPDTRITLYKENAVELTFETFSAGKEWKDASGTEARFTDWGVRYFVNKDYAELGIGLDIYSASDSRLNISTLTASINAAKVVWERDMWSFRPAIAIFSTPSTSSGLRGYKLELPIRYRVQNAFTVFAGFGYQAATMIGNPELKNTAKPDIVVGGLSLLAGIQYLF